MATQTVVLIQNVTAAPYTKAKFDSSMVGSLTFSKQVVDTFVSVTCSNAATGLSQTVLVGDFQTDAVGAPFTLLFDQMGIIITGQAAVDWSNPIFSTELLRTSAIADSICNSSTDVVIRASLPVNITIPFADTVLPAKSKADLTLGDYKGWVLYNEPTQADLSSDAKAPLNTWQPYYGDWQDISQLRLSTIDRIKSEKTSPLVMPDGTAANTFQYFWSNWARLDDQFLEAKYDGTTQTLLQFTFVDSTGKVDASRIVVYVNGITQLPNFTIDGLVVDCTFLASSLNIGDTVTVRYKAYQPTSAELSFDPDANPASDNPIVLAQYKYDYQYTTKEIRDDSGNLVSTKYYFWATNKNIATRQRSMSLANAASLMKKNTDPFAVFQNISVNVDGNPIYDQFISSGINQFVTEDNTYKIRFTKDFVLRDDPNNNDLKNVHTEWTIMREFQHTPIPEQLWNKLTDAVCGFDIAGNPVPSLARVAYDERNGTTYRFGFEPDQTFVDAALALASIKYTILNTAVTTILPTQGGIEVSDPIEFIDQSKIDDYFVDVPTIRKTMTDIWNNAKPQQVNEIFFAVLNDALSENYEFTDIFKTSMIAAHSIRLFSSPGTL